MAYTEEEQSVIDDILGGPKVEVGYGRFTFGATRDGFQSKDFDDEKFNDFLSIFFLGNDQFVRQFATNVKNYLGARTSGGMEPEGTFDSPDISLAEYHLYAEAVYGIPWDEMPPNMQDAINFTYESLAYNNPTSAEAASQIKENANVLIDLHEKGTLPEELQHISSDIVGTAISAGYTDQADLAYKAQIGKEAKDGEYIKVAAEAINFDSAKELQDKLDNDEITTQEYIAGIENIIDAEYGEDYVIDFINKGIADPTSMAGIFGPEETSPDQQEQIRAKQYFGETDYYGVGELDLDVYSEDTGQGTMPLYQTGLGTSLFANASPEDIMDTQLLLVESGFLQPFTFVYGVLDNNPGGTIEAIESAMSRFNLNGDGMARQDLFSILLAPGSTAANMNVFLKENFKDTLSDYGYGTGAFEPGFGGENAYQNIFQYTKPNFSNATNVISNAITEGLGRPASDGELQQYFDWWSKQDYSLQKQNFDIRQRNMQLELEDARKRRKYAGLGMSSQFTPSQLEGEVNVDAAMANSFNDFMRNTYGDIITGSQADAQYRKSFASLMGSLANISSQPGN